MNISSKYFDYLVVFTAGIRVYPHEMNNEGDHSRLLEAVVRAKGKVIISGYRSQLYDEYLSDWSRIEVDVAAHAAYHSGKTDRPRRLECIWANRAAQK